MTDEQALPELLAIQAAAVVDRAKSLGLTWTLRPATVSTVETSSLSATVIYDGDDVPVGCVSLIGTAVPTDRVMMLQIPPGGNYVIGRLPGSPFTLKTTTTFRGETNSLVDVTLTTSAQAVTPLTSLALKSAGEYIITGNADIDYFTAGTNNLVAVALQIDGVGLTEQIIFQTNASGNRYSLAHTWHGTLTAGTHTFQMIGIKSLATGGIATREVGTSFVYQIFQ